MTAKITLTWDNCSSEHVDQIVYRSAETFTVDNLPPVLARVGRNAREYIDTDIVTGNVYFYAVASENAAEEVLLSSVISITAESLDGDPHWDNVVALLHFDGDFTNETGGLVTTSGSLFFESGKFGSAVRFVRSASPRSFVYIRDLPIGTGDFTVECYIKLENLSLNNSIFDFRLGTGLSQLPLVESDGGNLYVWVNGAYAIGPAAFVMSSSEYKHLALVRESGVLYMWLDGSLIGYAGYTHDMGVAELTVGMSLNAGASNTSFDLSGQIDELRITKGIARYTENFTPPTEPFPNF